MASRATRELGLTRIGTMTRWMAGGTLVVGGVLSFAVAKALPGRSPHSSSPGVAGAASQAPVQGSSQLGGSDDSGSAVTPGVGDDSGSGSGLSSPVQAPQPVQSAPVVNSGGS